MYVNLKFQILERGAFMKKFKKLVAVVLVFAMLSMLPLSASALSMKGGLDPLKKEFVFAEGPVEEDYSIDYRYFSPVKKGDKTKYPLVIWLHGMGDGAEDGRQVNNSQIAYWASDEFQARFQPAGGAFILAKLFLLVYKLAKTYKTLHFTR